MADLDENLRAFLLANAGVTSITTTVAINNMPDTDATPYVWLQLDDENEPLNLNSSGGLKTAFFDCEATSKNLTEAVDLASAIKTALHAHTGSFGDQNVAYVEITSRDDTYETRQDFGDEENLHVSALTIEIGVDGR